jgi:hypothetical protein
MLSAHAHLGPVQGVELRRCSARRRAGVRRQFFSVHEDSPAGWVPLQGFGVSGVRMSSTLHGAVLATQCSAPAGPVWRKSPPRHESACAMRMRVAGGKRIRRQGPPDYAATGPHQAGRSLRPNPEGRTRCPPSAGDRHNALPSSERGRCGNRSRRTRGSRSMATGTLPTYFISHGGGPWPWMKDQMGGMYDRL